MHLVVGVRYWSNSDSQMMVGGIFANRKGKLWEMASLHQKKELITTDLYLIVGKSVMFTLKQAFTKKGKFFTRYCWHSNIFQRNADELLNVCSGGCKDYDRGLILFLFHSAEQADIAFSTPILIKDS